MSDDRPKTERDFSLTALATGDVARLRELRLNQISHNIGEWAKLDWNAESSPNLVTYEIVELAYSFPKRAQDLIESMRLLMKEDRVVAAVTLARSLVETIAMGRYFIDKMEKFLSDGDFPRLEAQFFRFYAGSKITDAKIKSIHVNDALRDLETADIGYISHLARIIHSASIFGSIFGADRNLRLLLGAAGHFRCGAEVREERFAG